MSRVHPPKRNRWYDEGYTWRGTLIFAGVMFGIGVLIAVVMLALGFNRGWSGLLIFGGTGIVWGVRARLLYRDTKRAEQQELRASETDGSPQS